MNIIAIAFLTFVLGLCILLDAVYQSLPLKELQRRAKSSKNKDLMAIHKIASYGMSVKIFLWSVGVICATTLIVWAPRRSWWLAVIVTLLIIWAVVIARPILGTFSATWKVAAFFAPAVSSIMELIHPLIVRFIPRTKDHHTRIYEREDLIDLLERQLKQPDNRMAEEELKIARGALTFATKKVASSMLPRKKVEWVKADEPIGPKIMDDLHKTGHTRFPVISKDSKPAAPTVVGVLYLNDLLSNLEKPGKISDVMKSGAHFINESDNLRQALDGFLRTGQHLLVVVNNFEEILGVITLEDVLKQLLSPNLDDFDGYHDRGAVAAKNFKE